MIELISFLSPVCPAVLDAIKRRKRLHNLLGSLVLIRAVFSGRPHSMIPLPRDSDVKGLIMFLYLYPLLHLLDRPFVYGLWLTSRLAYT